MKHLRQNATEIFRHTLEKMQPEQLVKQSIEFKDGDIYIAGKALGLNSSTPVYAVGAGKASARMALGLEQVLGDRLKDGIVIAPVGTEQSCTKIQVFEGTHPKPDLGSLTSSLEVMDFVRGVPEDACLLFLISGGASSLLEVPAGRLELVEVREVYDALLKCGANIQEMNTVRKQLSAVKGGKLLELTQAAKSVSLIISDVPGDDPAFIASGPTTRDNTTKKDALTILKKYKLDKTVPGAVIEYLSVSDLNADPELKTSHHTEVIGSSGLFAKVAAKECEALGYSTFVNKEQYTEESSKVAELISKEIRILTSGKRAHIFHGESTVHVKGDGKGGRNLHLALLMSKKISRRKNTLVLSAGTDGVDGNTDVAGAFATSDTSARARELGLEASEFESKFDSYHFFKSLGDLIFTGPTGNNVMDFQLILIDT